MHGKGPSEKEKERANRVTLHLIRLEYDFRVLISILGMHDVFYLLFKQPTDQVRMCVLLHYPMQKKWWVETKGVHEHQLGGREKLWPPLGYC